VVQRLRQPTAAKVAAEHANVSRLNSVMLMHSFGSAARLPLGSLPSEQMSALMQQWCDMTKALLSMLKAEPAATIQHPMCIYALARC
jgi:hypothetical protein